MVTRLQDVAGGLSSALAEAPQEAAQACYLPCSPDGHPLVGAIKGVSGAYIASGGPPAHRPPPSPGLRATLSSLLRRERPKRTGHSSAFLVRLR